jgi:esterase
LRKAEIMADTEAETLEGLRIAAAAAGMADREIVLPRDRDIILGRLRFHYLDWGETKGVPVVFLHGGGLTAHTWDLVCLELRDQYWCLAPDARGHGDTEWSREMDYGAQTHAADVGAFIRQLRLDRPVLVGMSMGGATAVCYAKQHGLRALIVIDTGPSIRAEGSQKIINFIQAPAEFESIDEVIASAMSFNPRRDPVLLRRSLQHNLMRLPTGKWTWKYDRRHYGMLDDPVLRARRAEIWSGIDQIQCPTLVVRGGQSDVFSTEGAVEFAGSLRNGRLTEVADAGHTVQGDNPRSLASEIRSFLGEVVAA